MADILSPTGIEKPLGSELHSRPMVNRNYDRTNQIAIDSNKQASGIMYRDIRTSASAATTTLSVIHNIASFTFKAGRKYRITWDYSAAISATGNYFDLTISSCAVTDASNLTTGLTSLVVRSTTSVGTGGEPGCLTALYEPVSDSTLQLKFTAERKVGAGTWTMESKTAYFIIEDEGAQY
jgi:hypothetical protein